MNTQNLSAASAAANAATPADAAAALASARTSTGQTVAELSMAAPVLLVFLRHFGCTFCREAMSDLAVQRASITARGVNIVLVHMVDAATAAEYLTRYGLGGLATVSDPHKELYRAMGLRRGTLWQLFGIKSFVRGFVAGILRGHLVGRLVGDGFQMPGVFLIDRGQVTRTYRHESAADRPDYVLQCVPHNA
jgi:peroxiredoxin